MPIHPPNKAIPVHFDFLNQALNLSHEIIREPIKYNESDHFTFMILCFLHKQIEHAESIVTLVENNHLTDITIIARVMNEGLIKLLWVSIDSSNRALLWRSFSLVSDWKVIAKDGSEREKKHEKYKVELSERLQEFGSPFLTKRNKQNVKYSDPYQNDWSIINGERKDVSKMIAEIGDNIYRKTYEELSQIVHWTPRGVAIGITREEDRLEITYENLQNTCMALAIAFDSVFKTTQLLESQLNLGFEDRLLKLFDEYVKAAG